MPIPIFKSALFRTVVARCGLAAMIVVASGAGGAALAALPGLTCKSVVFKGTGFHYSKDGARKMALVRWIEQVTAAYGSSWAGWGRAAQQSLSCTHNPSQSQHGWLCVARGRPCRYRNPGVTPHRFRTPHPARPRQRLRRDNFRRDLRRRLRRQ